MTGGESAADVKLLLENHVAAYTEKVGQIDTKDAAQDTAIANAQTQADKGVADAAQVASDLDAAELLIAANAREIETVKGTITTVNETLSGKVTALENKDTEIAGLISGLDTTVKGHTTAITEHGNKITALENEDLRLAALIQGNTDKFGDYYTSTQVDAKIKEVSDVVGEIDLTPFAKTEDVEATYATIAALEGVSGELSTEIERAKAAEKKIADDLALLIENPTEDLDSVKELIAHVKAHGTAVEGIVSRLDGHDAAIQQNTNDIAAINEALDAIVQPKASNEVTVAEDGTLGLGEVSTDKLVLGVNTLVLNGGTAAE